MLLYRQDYFSHVRSLHPYDHRTNPCCPVGNCIAVVQLLSSKVKCVCKNMETWGCLAFSQLHPCVQHYPRLLPPPSLSLQTPPGSPPTPQPQLSLFDFCTLFGFEDFFYTLTFPDIVQCYGEVVVLTETSPSICCDGCMCDMFQVCDQIALFKPITSRNQMIC